MKIKSLFTSDKLQLWLLVLLVGLLSLASYWVREIVNSHANKVVKVARTRPDYYIDNFNFVKMLPDGKGKYRVVGSKLVHFPSDDHADVTQPVISNLDIAQPPLTVRANRGVVKNIADKAENEVHFYDKVIVDRPKTTLDEHLRLNTDYLLAYPDKNTMETDFPVELLYGTTVTTGVGMKANNATQHIEILKDVHSIFPPTVSPNSKK